jgi:MFS transporter, ACS family, tartrate transporter
MNDLQTTILHKIAWRIMPLVILGYFLAYIDKINVGFAALTMRPDLNMTATIFGFTTGLFFWGYALLEVPSNLALVKYGARIWLSRIMITWGIISASTAFVTDSTSYGIVRILLGVAEAGFFPGILLYLSYWFPKKFLARAYGIFTLALVFSPLIGAPLSTAIMQFDGLFGLKGWQIMFLAEALPAVLFGFVILFLLPENPSTVEWLSASEKSELQKQLEPSNPIINKHDSRWYHACVDPNVLLIATVYLCYTIGSIGMVMFLPQIVKSLGQQTMMTTGWLSSIPYLAGAISLIVFGWSSDRLTERRWHVTIGLATTTIGFIIAACTMGSYWAMIGLSLAAVGMYGKMGAFWALCRDILQQSKSAVGFAFINSIGQLGGFIGPFIIGWAHDISGGFAGSISVLIVFSFLGTILSTIIIRVFRNSQCQT